jgi:hypothetical protein
MRCLASSAAYLFDLLYYVLKKYIDDTWNFYFIGDAAQRIH